MSERIAFDQLPETMVAALMAGENYVNSTGLEKRLLKLLRLYASQLNQCAYCIDMHFKEGMAAGIEPLNLYSLPVWRETDYYSEAEQAVLTLVEQITRIREAHELEPVYEQLTAFFSKDEIAQLMMAVSQANTWNRIAKGIGMLPGRYQPAS